MNVLDVLEIVAQVVGVASAVAAMVPGQAKLSGWLLAARKAIDVIALNLGNAKNK